jgi:hypothetical protein
VDLARVALDAAVADGRFLDPLDTVALRAAPARAVAPPAAQAPRPSA